MATGAEIIAGLGLVSQVGFGLYQGEQQRKAQQRQEQAMADAQEEQRLADEAAELRRLESLAATTSGQQERIGRFDFGIDSRAANMPALQAARATSDEDETNPFYSRGLA